MARQAVPAAAHVEAFHGDQRAMFVLRLDLTSPDWPLLRPLPADRRHPVGLPPGSTATHAPPASAAPPVELAARGDSSAPPGGEVPLRDTAPPGEVPASRVVLPREDWIAVASVPAIVDEGTRSAACRPGCRSR